MCNLTFLGTMVLSTRNSTVTINNNKNVMEWNNVPICELRRSNKYRPSGYLRLRLVSTRFDPKAGFSTSLNTQVILSGPNFSQQQIQDGNVILNKVLLTEVDTTDLINSFSLIQYEDSYYIEVNYQDYMNFKIELKNAGNTDEAYGDSSYTFQIFGIDEKEDDHKMLNRNLSLYHPETRL
jgi:hypothetical protein